MSAPTPGPVAPSLEGAPLEAIATGVASGRVAAEALRTGREESLTVRVRFEDGGSAVLKLWSRPGWRGWCRRVSRTGPAQREWRMLGVMRGAGVRAPTRIALTRVRDAGARYTDALYTEDLGPCVFALNHIKASLAAGREDEARRIEDGMIETTGRLLGASVLDADNRATNYVVRADGELVRLDFEIARRARWPGLSPRLYGATLGALVGSYTFAVQPEAWRAEAFAGRLAERVRPPARALRAAREHVEGMLERQRRTAGVDTRLRLAW